MGNLWTAAALISVITFFFSLENVITHGSKEALLLSLLGGCYNEESIVVAD